MISSTAVLSMVGVILLTVLDSGLADRCDDPNTQDEIRATLIEQLCAGTDGQVMFKKLVDDSLVNNGPSTTKTDICDTITARHNTNNQHFLGVAISSAECQEAFTIPDPADLTKWAGKHCFQAGTPRQDDAEWALPSPCQSMKYYHRGSPCCSPYNKFDFANKVIIGYDPLDNIPGYDCYQGTYVAHPFTVASCTGSGSGSGGCECVDCMVKVTGTSAFLECLNHCSDPIKRTSAGYFDGYYAHYYIKGFDSTCR